MEIAQQNGADALARCHRSLELDGADHDYDSEEWLSTVWDIAAPFASVSAPGHRPTDARAGRAGGDQLAGASDRQLDQGSEEAPASIAETLARLLAVWIFTDVALPGRESIWRRGLTALGTVSDFPQGRNQPVDRDHQDTTLVALDASRADHAQDGQRPRACTTSAGADQASVPARGPDRDVARRRFGSSSQSRIPSRSARSPPSQRPHRPAGAAHGAAGSLVARHADARWVQGFLGHSKLTTTERYLHAKARPQDVDVLNRAFAASSQLPEATAVRPHVTS